MANRRKEIPSFVSIEVGVARSIAEAMTDDEWGKWSKKALDDISIGCTRKDTDARVRNLYEKAKDNMDKEYLRKKEWYENRKAQGNQFTADVDTREGSQSKYEVSAITRNEIRSTYDLDTSANHCGPRQAKNGGASHREAEDESANASNPFALDMPSKVNAKTRDSLGRGRYQPPSLGPEDGNLYDQVPDKVSTDEKRTGGHSPLSKSPSSRPPVRQSEPDVMSLAYAGEFGNVRLTQEQYAQLGIKFGNQQKLNRAIDSLSCLIENGEKNPQNHYAELLKWVSYRDDMEEKEELRASSAPHYETVSEHNARIVRESDAWIHEYCQQQKKNRKAANG